VKDHQRQNKRGNKPVFVLFLKKETMSLFCSSFTIEGYFQISINVVPLLYLRVTLNSPTSLTRSSKHINISTNPFVIFCH